MIVGLIHTTVEHKTVYRKLRRQVITEFGQEIARATGWKKEWLQWKRAITLEIRYNELLFSSKSSRSIQSYVVSTKRQ